MNLFAYGTLMWPDILEAVMGRRMAGRHAVLAGYTRLRVKGQHYPAAVPAPDESVEGTLYTGLTPKEFEALDRFEGREYDRIEVDIGGTPVFVYVLAEEWRHIADSSPWTPADLLPEQRAAFCAEYKGWSDLQS